MKKIISFVTMFCVIFGVYNQSYAQNTSDTKSGVVGSSAGLEEIIVTAEKRTQSIQDVPAAVVAFTGEEFTAVGLQNIVDMTTAFPSARFENDGYATHLYIRGVGSEQDRISVDQLVAMIVDGVPLPREVDSVAQFDVHDIELLPGPQGTLYGAGAVGGVISIANNRPVDHYETIGTLTIGNYATIHGTAIENIPINDKFLARAAVDYSRHSAYETGDSWTGDELNGRVSVLFKPVDDFTAYVWGQATRDFGLPPGASASGTATDTFDDPGNPWNVTGCASAACTGKFGKIDQGPAHTAIHNFILGGQFDWSFDEFTVTDIPSFVYSHVDQLLYGEAVPISENVSHHQFTNELKATSNPGTFLQWIAGLYGTRDVADQRLSIIAPNFVLPQFNLETLAPYGQATYSIYDWLHVTGGGRFTWNRKEGTYSVPGPYAQTSASWRNIDWKIGLEADVTPASLIYATIQTASEPGTLDAQDAINGKPIATENTKLLSFTVGSKNRFFDNRLEINNEAYYYNYKDFLIQTVFYTDNCGGATPPCSINAFYNATKMVIFGDQLDIKARVTDNDQLKVGLAYNHARTRDFITNAGLNLGNQAPIDAPDVTVTLSGQHIFDLGDNSGTLVLRADSRFENSYETDFETSPGSCNPHCPTMRQKPFTNTDLALTYYPPSEEWTIGLFAKNVENEAQLGVGSYLGFSPTTQGVHFISEPQTFGLTATVHLD